MSDTIETPLVSVIVPMYNVERFLPKCLDSILAQTERRIEVICVDDCSPDGSAVIADGYAERDSRLRVVRRETNGTLGPARNSGIDVARGEYVTFVDSDDWIDSGMVADLYRAATAFGTGADICFSGFRDVRDGQVTAEHPHPMGGMFVTRSENVARFRLEFFGAPPNRQAESPCPISACAALYRRAWLDENSLRFNAMRSEDIDFNVRALRRAGAVACSSGVFYNYRNDGQPSITRSFKPTTSKSFYDLFEKLEALVADEPEPWHDDASLRTSRRICDYARVLVGLIATSGEEEHVKAGLVADVCSEAHVSRAARSVPARRLSLKQGVFLLGLRFRAPRFLLFLTGLRKRGRK